MDFIFSTLINVVRRVCMHECFANLHLQNLVTILF